MTDGIETSEAQRVEAAPARRSLTPVRILQASLQLIDQQGLKTFTMRKLAQELAVDPMSIYRHFKNKDALLDGVAEVLWEEVERPGGDAGWEDLLRSIAISLRALARVHPYAYALLLSRQSLPLALLQLFDVSLEQLQRVGFERKHATEVLCTVCSYAIGYAMVEISVLLPDQSERGALGMTEIGRLTQVMRRLPRETPARLVEVACELMDCNADAQFAFGLDLMLTSLRRG